METLKALENIKETLIDERGKLIQKRSKLNSQLNQGLNFFCASQQYSRSELERAAVRMAKIVRSIVATDKEIFDLDIAVGTKFEALLSDCEVKVTMSEKKNDMGEISKENGFIFDLFPDDEKITVTPEDLWIIKILKPALKYCNIESLPREK